MTKLDVTNKSGSRYQFRILDKRLVIEAFDTKGKMHIFTVAAGVNVEDNKLKTTQGRELPISSNKEDIISFIANAETRTMMSYETEEEMLSEKAKFKRTGESFFSFNKHCFYVYNK